MSINSTPQTNYAPLVYLASPYSSLSLSVKEMRFNDACRAAGFLMQTGLHIFSPIAHSHTIARWGDLDGDFSYWEKFCLNTLARCNGMIILELPGWDKSIGVAAENREALRLGYPIFHVVPALLEDPEALMLFAAHVKRTLAQAD